MPSLLAKRDGQRAADRARAQTRFAHSLSKTPTGIAGLDEVTGGGLPKGRPTLLCGGTGTGKTLFAVEFLVRGATDYGEPGLLVSFEERPEELAANVRSLGFRLKELQAQKRLAIDYVRIERSEIAETGEYNLDGLFIRLGAAIDRIKARRIAFDTLESLYSGLQNHFILRAELRRLFIWLRERGITAIVTAERGEGTLTRYGLEEYIADCVILLDHRVADEVSTRYLRVVKLRGSVHRTNEFPFLIGERGLRVMPITSIGLQYGASRERISSGIARVDTMLGGKGYYRASSVLVIGTPGTGKTTVAATFADSVCRRGQRCLYAAFEESAAQVVRNMHSVGIDLGRWIAKGLLTFRAMPATAMGLEDHLLSLAELVGSQRPAAMVIDPITNLISVGSGERVKRMLLRLAAFVKSARITLLCTALVRELAIPESTTGISSMMDACLVLDNSRIDSEYNRLLYILKARGMHHSSEVREFRLTSKGIRVLDVYAGAGPMLMGTARMEREAGEREKGETQLRALERRRREAAEHRRSLQAQIDALARQMKREEEELEAAMAAEQAQGAEARRQRAALMEAKMADVGGNSARRAPRER